MKNVVVFAAALAVFVVVGAGFASRVGAGAGRVENRRPPFARVISGRERAESVRKLERFESIKLPGSGTVRIHIGAEPSVTVRADSRVLERVETSVRGDELVLNVRGPQLGSSVEYEVTAPSLAAVRISGSGDVIAQDVLTGKSLRIDIGGSGSFSGPVRADSLSVDINGSGDVTLNGTAGDVDFEIRGSGDLDAGALDGGRASVAIMGSGDTTLGTFEELDAKVMGSGDVRYRGDPRITASTPGSGDLIRR